MNLYAPGRQEIDDAAQRATLANRHVDAKGWLLEKVRHPTGDWNSRALCTVPGIVWTVSSDTCMTGRPSAPANIAYDEFGREFVYRQPANEAELAGVMSADSEEVFACYRFDGLERWTVGALDAWLQDHFVITGWMTQRLTAEPDGEVRAGLEAAFAYQTSNEFRDYLVAFGALLRERGGPAVVPVRRQQPRLSPRT